VLVPHLRRNSLRAIRLPLRRGGPHPIRSPTLVEPLGREGQEIVWNGRVDFIELWSAHNISIGKNVCDLQVAEVLSRSNFRGERDDERSSRLAMYFGPQVWKNPLQFAGIHRVVGLQQCLEENGYRGLVGKDRESLLQFTLSVAGSTWGRVLTRGIGCDLAEVTKMHRQNDTKAWPVRPLPWKLLCYAAADIHLIALHYEDFSAKGWLPLGSKFFGRCNRYVTMHEQLVASGMRRDASVLGLSFRLEF